MEIIFVSDYVCPYCLVAKEAMKQAIKELKIGPAITWHPFELTREPAPRVDTYHDEERKSHYQILVEPAKKLGLDMKLPPRVVPRPYTRLAFEGFYFAWENGRKQAYNDRIYRAYFEEEQDIGDREVLKRLAAEVGLDPQRFDEALEYGIYTRQVEKDNRHAREELKVSHVPTIIIDGKEVAVNSYTKEEFMDILKNADGHEASGKADTQVGCGPDGCSF